MLVNDLCMSQIAVKLVTGLITNKQKFHLAKTF